MLKAILVDLDGTLIHTSEANSLAYCQALAEFGYTVSFRKFLAVAEGKSWATFLPELTGVTCLEQLKPIALRKRELYGNHLSSTIMNSTLLQLLQMIRDSTLIALVTTASRHAVEQLLNHHQLNDFFHLIVTGDDVIESKPHPEAYQLAALKLGVTPSECIIFEDSVSGIKAAQLFGAQVFQVLEN